MASSNSKNLAIATPTRIISVEKATCPLVN